MRLGGGGRRGLGRGSERVALETLTMKTDRRRQVEMAAEMSLAMPYSRTERNKRRPRGSGDLSLGL
jgi:hypothetical protein